MDAFSTVSRVNRLIHTEKQVLFPPLRPGSGPAVSEFSGDGGGGEEQRPRPVGKRARRQAGRELPRKGGRCSEKRSTPRRTLTSPAAPAESSGSSVSDFPRRFALPLFSGRPPAASALLHPPRLRIPVPRLQIPPSALPCPDFQGTEGGGRAAAAPRRKEGETAGRVLFLRRVFTVS